MPFRAFDDSDRVRRDGSREHLPVLMPFRAFDDSDTKWNTQTMSRPFCLNALPGIR